MIRYPIIREKLNRIEKPLLIYPIGSLDDDPERILTFEGFWTKAKYTTGRRHRRAIITIDLFKLNYREHLIRERCDVIINLWRAFKDSASKESDVKISGTKISIG